VTIKLRPYQSEAIAAVMAAIADGSNRPAVVLPTGAGKTVVFSALASQWQAEHGGRVVILAHREELIRQAADKYRSVNPNAVVGIVKAERNETSAPVVVASVQTLAGQHRLDQLDDVSLVIVDECHHATAPSYRRVLDHFGGTAVGFTATMARGDGAALGTVWDQIAYERSILRMIRDGYLVDVAGVRIEVPDLDLSGVRKIGGDYSEGVLGDRIMDSIAPATVASAYRQHAAGKSAILFAPTVQTAQVFAEAFEAEGFTSRAVWGDIPKDERRQVLADFDAGRVDVLCNCMVLTEGFDSPRAEVCIIARPTASAPLYVQMVGRVLRPWPGKARALVLDVVGAAGRHELATLAVLGGEQDIKPKTGQTLLAALEDLEAEAEPESLIEGGYVGEVAAVTVDLFAGSRQQWLQTAAGYWFLPAGSRFIVLMPCKPEAGDQEKSCPSDCDGCSCHLGHAPCGCCSDHWEAPDAPPSWDVAWASTRNRSGGYIARGVTDLGYAMAQGEGDITDDEEILARKEGAWRKRKATEKQISYARGLRIAEPEGGFDSLRAGALGDLISCALASKRVDKAITARLA
jgi:superfamily II DNA or RNA helicase